MFNWPYVDTFSLGSEFKRTLQTLKILPQTDNDFNKRSFRLIIGGRHLKIPTTTNKCSLKLLDS